MGSRTSRVAAMPPTTDPLRELPAWPVGVLLVGFPVWWALGFSWLAVLGSALLMLVLLIARGRVELPPGFGIWAVFLVFAIGAAVELDGALRLVGFAVRIANYVGSTIVLLYVYNAGRALSPDKLIGYVACYFATVATGGWLGVVVPHGTLPTIAEKVLPPAVRNNGLVSALVHPAFAEVQQPFGSPVSFARPSAPFPFTNSWGCNVALLVPLLIAGLVSARTRRLRSLIIALMVYATVPAAATLNRGMFIAIGAALAYAAVLYALRGRVGAFLGLAAFGLGGYLLAASTGVIATLQARLQFSQSNAGRLEIYREAWRGAVASPLFGNGAPRPSDLLDISVGTQGQVWNLMFSYGFPALAGFVGFFVYAAARTFPIRTGAGPWLHVMMVIVVLTLVYYGYDGPQLSIAMVGAALALRPRPREPAAESVPTAPLAAAARLIE
jgi:polysaccharide biosynthesis protein PslJ